MYERESYDDQKGMKNDVNENQFGSIMDTYMHQVMCELQTSIEEELWEEFKVPLKASLTLTRLFKSLLFKQVKVMY